MWSGGYGRGVVALSEVDWRVESEKVKERRRIQSVYSSLVNRSTAAASQSKKQEGTMQKNPRTKGRGKESEKLFAHPS